MIVTCITIKYLNFEQNAAEFVKCLILAYNRRISNLSVQSPILVDNI